MTYFEAAKHYNRVVKLLGSKKDVKIVFFNGGNFQDIEYCKQNVNFFCKDSFQVILIPNGTTPNTLSEHTKSHLKGEYELYTSAISAVVAGYIPTYVYAPFKVVPLSYLRRPRNFY